MTCGAYVVWLPIHVVTASRRLCSASTKRRPVRPLSTMALASTEPRRSALVDLAWMREQDALKVLDASWWMPNVPKEKRLSEEQLTNIQEKLKRLLRPKAAVSRFDIDTVKDSTNALPHMMPTQEQMANFLAHMGLTSAADVIAVYSVNGFVASARCWWMLRAFSFENVFVLDGGIDPSGELFQTQAEAGAGPGMLTSTPTAEQQVAGQLEQALKAQVKFRPELVWNKQDVLRFVASKGNAGDAGKSYLLDARSKGRFNGTEPEPRAGLPSGHVPGSLSLPFQSVLQSKDGKMKRGAELRDALASCGLVHDDSSSPVSVACTCGSGVTAGVTALALHEAGIPDAAVYDGSWTEYGADASCPKA